MKDEMKNGKLTASETLSLTNRGCIIVYGTGYHGRPVVKITHGSDLLVYSGLLNHRDKDRAIAEFKQTFIRSSAQ